MRIMTRMNASGHQWLGGLLCGLALLAAGGRDAAAEGYKRIADQPIPVRWAGGAHKLPLRFQTPPDDAATTEAVHLAALRNEAESFQVSIGAGLPEGTSVADVELSALRRDGGDARLTGDDIELRTVGLVRDRKTGEEYPDVLFPLGEIDGPGGGYAYTLWVTVYVPGDAPAGRYRGPLKIALSTPNGKRRLTIPVELRVRDYTLPRDVRVDTQLFSVNMGSVDRWFGFEDREARTRYLTERVYPRYVRNRISPGRFVPESGPLYRSEKPYRTDGPAGPYRHFDGTIGQGTGFHIDQKQDFTVALRLKPAKGRSGSFLTQWGGGARGMEWKADDGGVSLRFQAKKEGRSIESIDVPLKPGRWSRLAVVVENPAASKSVVTAYVNGERAARETIPGLKPSGRTIKLGSAYRTGIRPYTGDLDQVRVYPRALDAETIRRIQGDAGAGSTSPAFVESYSEKGGPPVVGKRYLEKWGRYWRDRGLFLNQLPFRKNWSEEETREYFSRIAPVIREHGWGPYLYVRLPFDEATHGRKARRNQRFARMMERIAPGVRTHQTFGSGLRGDAIEESLEPYAGLVDIWCSVAGLYLQRENEINRWIQNRRREHGERVSWYIHRNISVGNHYKDFYTAMDLRGFFWRMFQHRVSMCALWSTTNWDRRTRKHRDRDPRRVERGFEIRPSTPLAVGNGLLFYPGADKESMILDSVRAQIIRDGIEDYQYASELRKVWKRTKDPKAKALLEKIGNIKGRYVRFGPTVELDPEALRELRVEMAKGLASSATASGSPGAGG